jgi:hypothetical protein
MTIDLNGLRKSQAFTDDSLAALTKTVRATRGGPNAMVLCAATTVVYTCGTVLLDQELRNVQNVREFREQESPGEIPC